MDLEDLGNNRGFYAVDGTATWLRMGRVGGFAFVGKQPLTIDLRALFAGLMLGIAPHGLENVLTSPLGVSWVYPADMTAVMLTAADSMARSNVETKLARMGVGASSIYFHADTLVPVPVCITKIEDGWNFSFSGASSSEPVLIAPVVLDAAAMRLRRDVGCTEARRIKQQLMVRHPGLDPEALLVETARALNDALGVMNSGERPSVIWPVPDMAAALWTPPGSID